MPALDPQTRTAIVAALRRGDPYAAICAALDVAVGLVSKVAQAEGLGRTPGPRGPRTEPTARQQQARELRKQGLTLAAVGAEMGISRQAAGRLLR